MCEFDSLQETDAAFAHLSEQGTTQDRLWIPDNCQGQGSDQ